MTPGYTITAPIEVIILAGGLGTRLRPAISELPKPMAPVRDKPFLEYIFLWLIRFNLKKIVLSVGYMAQVIESYFGHEFRGIPVEYSRESYPLGTGGAIMTALHYTETVNVLVVNGDTYFPIDINSFFSFHSISGSMITVALKRMTDFDRYGAVEIDMKGNIVHFREKIYMHEGYINGGMYLINKEYINTLNVGKTFSFESEILEKEVGNRLKGMVFENRFIDIGIPGEYDKAGQLL